MTDPSILTREQKRDLRNSRGVAKGYNVRGSDSRIYRILYDGDCNNILAVFNFFGKDFYYLLGRNPGDWYSHPEDESRFLAQKVHLECDAKPFRQEEGACRIGVEIGSPEHGKAILRMLRMGDYGGKI